MRKTKSTQLIYKSYQSSRSWHNEMVKLWRLSMCRSGASQHKSTTWRLHIRRKEIEHFEQNRKHPGINKAAPKDELRKYLKQTLKNDQVEKYHGEAKWIWILHGISKQDLQKYLLSTYNLDQDKMGDSQKIMENNNAKIIWDFNMTSNFWPANRLYWQ